ncbi:hypothetical protein Acsp02_96280 [Actinoplanes sp. NBRC 103695]|nr:hypothetical protein Acsp02_96280 [Actinoplanes sp. NBRC 103695]
MPSTVTGSGSAGNTTAEWAVNASATTGHPATSHGSRRRALEHEKVDPEVNHREVSLAERSIVRDMTTPAGTLWRLMSTTLA